MSRDTETWRYGIILKRGGERVMFVRWLSDYFRRTPIKSPTDRFEGIRLGKGATPFHKTGDTGVYVTNSWRIEREP